MKSYKYISSIPVDEIRSGVVIPCINENGFRTILVKNTLQKTVVSEYATDNLSVKMDTVLYVADEQFYFHIISANKNDTQSNEQFDIVYDYVFNKIEKPISATELSALILSLEEYFRTTPDANLFNLQVGVFGELLTIKYLYDSNYSEIIEKYHNNFYSKHDVEINSFCRIEIKTTISERRIHNFKHNQIYRTDTDVFVASVMLEQAKEGLSLYDLFQQILTLYSSPDSIFSLRKLMKRCNVDEEHVGPTFSLEKALNDLKIYAAAQLPKLELTPPKGVSAISYDVDCSMADDIEITEFIRHIRTTENAGKNIFNT